MKKLMYVLASSLLLAAGLTTADDHSNGKSPIDATYSAECGSCHVPYPTRLLSANEWKKITSRLDKHFGVDASVDVTTLKKLDQYLMGNSASTDRTTASNDKLPRITESRWFIHEHSEVAPQVWKRPNVKSPSNCSACHQNMNLRRAY